MDNTKISWTDATWNPLAGCSIVSDGCRNCYAMRTAHRFAHLPRYAGTTRATPTGPKWTGKVNLVPEVLDQPLRWKKPRRIFVNSMSDLFHENVPDEYIHRVFGIMLKAPQHTFQVLTKRPERMRELLSRPYLPGAIWDAHIKNNDGVGPEPEAHWPSPNIWLGVSVEDQKTADERIPLLVRTPAAVRWLSMEPLLGPVDLPWLRPTQASAEYMVGARAYDDPDNPNVLIICPGIDWVVVGGESGPGSRPMHPDWARSLRDQCQAAQVPFHFKQFGDWAPGEAIEANDADWPQLYEAPEDGGALCHEWLGPIATDARGDRVEIASQRPTVYRVGKKRAGRILDGCTWDEYPDTIPQQETA